MDLYSENLFFLQSNAPELYRKLTVEQEKFPAIAVYEDNGRVKVNDGSANCYLQSTYSIEEEYRWLLQGWSSDTDCVVLLGGACFAIIPYLLKQFPKMRTLVFVEPTLQIFKYFLQYNNFVELFRQTKGIQLIFEVNMSVQTVVTDLGYTMNNAKQFNFAALLAYQVLFPEYCKQVLNCLHEHILKQRMILQYDVTTQLKGIKEIVKNFQVKALPVECLKEIIQGKPVIVVGAGPSLNKNMHLLQQAADKAIIIACGKAVQILNNAGIRPHFNAGLDSLDVNYYDNLKFPDVPLIFANTFSSRILSEYIGDKFQMTLNYDTLSAYLYIKAKNRSTVFCSGTSIVNAIHNVVATLNCSLLIFIGQDMCFYDDRIYADINMEQAQDKFAASLEEKVDIYGNKVYTAPTYYSILWGIERAQQLFPNLPIINATEGGLGISNVVNQTLHDVLIQLPVREIPIQEEIAKIVDVTEHEDEIGTLECWDRLKCNKDVAQIIEISTEIIIAAEKLGKMYKRKAKAERLLNQIRVIKMIEKRLVDIPLYLYVIAPYLNSFFAIFETYEPHWNETDMGKKVIGTMNKYVGKMVEIRRYALLLKDEHGKISK